MVHGELASQLASCSLWPHSHALRVNYAQVTSYFLVTSYSANSDCIPPPPPPL